MKGLREMGHPALWLMLALSVLWIGKAWQGNLDLSQSRSALFMDERTTYDQVLPILHPQSARGCWHALWNGDEQRYGRIYFAANAATSWLPERLCGPQGQILATRLTQSLALLLAAWLLASLASGAWHRALILALCLVQPFSTYYASMPKPEPIQLLLLALFFIAWKKQGHGFGTAWFWAGLAFGAKISALPALGSCAVLALAWAEPRRLRDMLKAALCFAIGWGLAVPVLFEGKFRAWWSATFANTTHRSDLASLSWRDWLGLLQGPWFGSAWLLLGLCLLGGLCWLSSGAHRRDAETRSGRALCLAGLAWLLAIMFNVKRLWGFYLWPGMSLLLSGLLVIASSNWQQRHGRLSALLLALCMLVALYWPWATASAEAWRALSTRSSQSAHLQAVEELSALQQFAARDSARLGRPLRLIVDPWLYQPDNGPSMQVTDFWGPFSDWASRPDAVAFASPDDEQAASPLGYHLALKGPWRLRVYTPQAKR